MVTGDTLEKFKKANREKILAGETSTPEIPMGEEWPEKHNQTDRTLGRCPIVTINPVTLSMSNVAKCSGSVFF